MITCKNCDHSFKGNFCNNCGQTANTHDINFKSIIHEIQHSIFHIDKGILYTTKELLLRPGHTIRGYLNGKRVKHFKPFAYILILSTIYALLTKLSHKTNFLGDIFLGLEAGARDADRYQPGIFEDILLWMSGNYAYATLVILPLLSFSSYLCFFRQKYNFFQHLIINSFIAGQRTAVFLIFLPFTYFVTDQLTNDIIDNLKAVVGICLTFWTYYQFFNKMTPMKRVLATVATYLVTIIFSLVLIFLLLLTKLF